LRNQGLYMITDIISPKKGEYLASCGK